jgi:cytoskeletal protein CcmA (bactofilin family)
MWKSRTDEKPAAPAGQGTASGSTAYVPPKEMSPINTPSRTSETFRSEIAHIGKSVLIKGELSGSEDLYVDGEVEGSIELHDQCLIVGPNGRIRANVHARDITVHGKVDGNLAGSERVELKKSAVLLGDIKTQRIVIEDGAYFKGGIEIQKEAGKPETKSASASASGGSSYSSSAYSSPGASAAASAQSTLLEQKKY